MEDYYSNTLKANKLKQCYDLASPRIKQYLDAEINFVLENVRPTETILELGCGYGRVMRKLAPYTAQVYGIDTAQESLRLAQMYLKKYNNITLKEMDVRKLEFADCLFDVVIAIQNGISAFKINPQILIKESCRVTKNGGKILLSSYSEKIWKERLEWFVQQSEAGLLGEIDRKNTGGGIIRCKDGFEATTFTRKDFEQLAKEMQVNAKIYEVDDSSIFCVIKVKHK